MTQSTRQLQPRVGRREADDVRRIAHRSNVRSRFQCNATARHSLPPEVFEPIRRQRRVDRCAGDRPMPEPPLDGPGVVAFIGEGVAAGVAKHMGMGLELHAGCIGRPLDHASEAGSRERRSPLADKDKRRRNRRDGAQH
jgi:hypothetical protein